MSKNNKIFTITIPADDHSKPRSGVIHSKVMKSKQDKANKPRKSKHKKPPMDEHDE
jgi:hypothetical protein